MIPRRIYQIYILSLTLNLTNVFHDICTLTIDIHRYLSIDIPFTYTSERIIIIRTDKRDKYEYIRKNKIAYIRFF